MWAGINKNAPGGCWEWLGALQRDGYAHFNRGRKTISLHRYVYERMVGPIPPDMDLLHLCDNRRCCNPKHMKQGSHQDNMADAYRKKRHAWGPRCHFAKISPEVVQEIRRNPPKGRQTKEVADRLGVLPGTIRAILTGRSWKLL